ncbi:MAG: hypothetical protein ACRDRZ_12120 [Pseudonocardiaceae bacterium]
MSRSGRGHEQEGDQGGRGRAVPGAELADHLTREILKAFRAGHHAASVGVPAWADTPHHGTPDNARERVLSTMWRRGYQSATRGFPLDFAG